MHRLLKVAAALVCAVGIPALASTTSVTATLTDSDSSVWSSCTWTAVVASPVPPTISGVAVPVDQLRSGGSCNSSGALSATMLNTSSVDQAGVTWTFTIIPNAGPVPSSVITGVTTASGNLTSVLSAGITVPRFYAGDKSYGYADAEVKSPVLGDSYYNVATPCLRQNSLSGWTCGGGGSSGSTLPAFADVQSYLDFKDTAGATAAADKIGTNSCTVGANAPVFNGQGLVFSAINQNCSFPAALNTAKTFYYAVYINPITTGGQTSNGYSPLMTSSLGNPGKNVLLAYAATGSSTPSPNVFIFSLDVYSGTNLTATVLPMSGFHVIAYVCGTAAVDHLYIDGNEVNQYSIQNASGTCTAQSSGNLFLSGNTAAPWSGTSGFLGTFYGFASSTNAHTAAQVLTNTVALQQAVEAKGVPIAPQQKPNYSPMFTVAGDSITCGFGLVTPCTTTTPSPNTWPQNLTLTNQPAYVTNVNAITGIWALAVAGAETERGCNRIRTTGGISVYSQFLATNDFSSFVSGSTVATNAMAVWQRLIGIKNEVQACGATHVFVGSMISRGGNDSAGNSWDADKDELNRLMYSQWRQAGFAGVLPFGINPSLGADAANVSATFFQSDHIHPTQTGQNLLFPLASNAYNYVFGSSAASPHVVTAVPYTQLASDGFVTLSGLSAGGNITATTCQSPIGVTFTIQNPQSAQAITWTPLAGELANGSSSAVTIPSNGYLKATSNALPPSTGGCFWTVETDSL